jgi:porphobilinogen synthase
MVRETTVNTDDLVYPLFVVEGNNAKKEIGSMPGNFQLSIEHIVSEAKDVEALGIPAILLFGIPEKKDEAASGAYDDEGVVQQAVREIKKATSGLQIITDVCLCEYMSHGHCGVIKNNDVDNDITLELLAKTALSHAEAGADIVAPSDMMDGRVAAIRGALDNSDFNDVPIMSYAAKYASSFYGPFREAAESVPQFGDRRSYQMDPPNSREAIREIAMDVEEGADIVMVKPALPYLDIIRQAKEQFDFPVAAYNVSGEYSMVKAAAQKGWLDEKKVVKEILTSIKRAGADIIITYHAKDFVGWQKQ